MELHPDIAEVRITADEIAARVRVLGQQISRDYEGKDLVLVGILTGATLFLADLVRAMDIPLSFDFVAVGSYGEGTKASGVVRIMKDLEEPVESRHVLVIEDVMNEKLSLRLRYLLDNLRSRRAASVRVCTLLDKTPPEKHEAAAALADYRGFEMAEEYLVGYGLDYTGKYRSLPYIGVLKPVVFGG
ncbi:MAG: hypoxanthine phosphoribosyltransferase [Fibrella sp.]|nr:hypoxanthine phosphoribosyltransferase [Armatimonadota bacterium]